MHTGAVGHANTRRFDEQNSPDRRRLEAMNQAMNLFG
jgi:hypothetical protein